MTTVLCMYKCCGHNKNGKCSKEEIGIMKRAVYPLPTCESVIEVKASGKKR